MRVIHSAISPLVSGIPAADHFLKGAECRVKGAHFTAMRLSGSVVFLRA